MGTPVVTERVDGDVDLLAIAGGDGCLFERGRAGLAGRGVALRIPSRDPDLVAEALAAFDVDDRVGLPGCGPVAMGALPFDPSSPGELVVPAEIWGRAEDGTRWRTVVGGGLGGSAANAAPVRDAGRFTVASTHPPEHFEALVAAATKAIAGGELEKVVLAREVQVTAGAPIDVAALLGNLRRAYPGCFLAHLDGFVAASPELLVARNGDVVRAHPMAGTAPRAGDPNADARLAAALLASPSYRHEHQVTIDVVHDTLLPWCSYLDYEAEPSVVPLANVQHLATLVEGRLSHPAPSVLELVRALHPTPAVCGRPRDAALRFIAEHEGLDRGRYAGTYGWVDARGNGQWAVSIRCADITGASASVHAGNGIVADSDPATELAETRSKLQAILGALVRP